MILRRIYDGCDNGHKIFKIHIFNPNSDPKPQESEELDKMQQIPILISLVFLNVYNLYYQTYCSFCFLWFLEESRMKASDELFLVSIWDNVCYLSSNNESFL